MKVGEDRRQATGNRREPLPLANFSSGQTSTASVAGSMAGSPAFLLASRLARLRPVAPTSGVRAMRGEPFEGIPPDRVPLRALRCSRPRFEARVGGFGRARCALPPPLSFGIARGRSGASPSGMVPHIVRFAVRCGLFLPLGFGFGGGRYGTELSGAPLFRKNVRARGGGGRGISGRREGP